MKAIKCFMKAMKYSFMKAINCRGCMKARKCRGFMKAKM